MKVTLNVNDVVRVTLGQRGAEILTTANSKGGKTFRAGDKFETEFWRFCQIFGPTSGAGQDWGLDEVEVISV